MGEHEKMEWYTLVPDFGAYTAFNSRRDLVEFTCDTKFVLYSEVSSVVEAYEARIKELEEEMARLKRVHAFEKKQAELWRDKAEKLEHEKHPEHFDHDRPSCEGETSAHHNELCVTKSEPCYNPLKMFYEIAEKYFSVSTPQDLENAIKGQRERNEIVNKDYLAHLKETAARAVSENTPAPEWHVFDEKNPPKGNVLCLQENGVYNVGYYVEEDKTFIGFGPVFLGYVTHWMPLPPPPAPAESEATVDIQ